MPTPKSPLRIFSFSIFASLAILLAIIIGVGPAAALVTLILIAVEITFSFDNAIINAKVLGGLSPRWQTVFLTAGMVVAIFGMRIVFPIMIVTLTSHLPWHEVLNLALHKPDEYAHYLEKAHVAISSFGGAFLLMLALNFFFDDNRKVLWWPQLERRLQRAGGWWLAPCIAVSVVVLAAFLPNNPSSGETLRAGLLGIVVYAAIQLLVAGFQRLESKATKGAGRSLVMTSLVTLLYLELLDASFSFDSVIGAFAVTDQVLLIAAGLGIGALWVRSLTVFMVHRGTLDNYPYLEHGAHYTVAVLALVMFVSLFVNVPEVITGMTGIGLIAASLLASREGRRARL